MNLGWRNNSSEALPRSGAPRNPQSRRGTKFILLALLLAIPVLAQTPVTDILVLGLGDVAALKQNAEAGNAEAQVKLGNALSFNFRQKEALDWYRKAAAQGNIDAQYHVGQMLLFGAYGASTNMVQPNQAEGLRWTFMAATNLNPGACHNMIKASGQGLGTNPDPVAAYAWLILFSETPTSALLGRAEMNELALRMSTGDIQRAQSLAAEWKAGHWQPPVIRVTPEGDSRLKLNGIAFGTTTSLAVINGKSLQEGQSAKIILNPRILNVRCLKIRKDSVLISIDGEDQPRVLRLSR